MDVGDLGADFRFRRIRRGKVAREASRSVSRACLGTKNEGCAFRHVIDVARSGHQIRWRTRRIPYLARQLSVFTAKPAQGYP